MFLGKKKINQIIEHMETGRNDQSYWAIVKRQYAKNRMAVWSLRILFVIVFIALFSDFIANEKPIYCKINNTTYFPIFKSYAVDLGWSKWEAQFFQKEWSEHEYESVWFPPIPYSASTIDSKNSRFRSPFGPQNVPSNRYWHWLGTDSLGRDVAAGMVKGTRVAMLVGIIAMVVAATIGIILGAFAGYFGDEHLKISRGRLLLLIPGTLLAFFYAFTARYYPLTEGNTTLETWKSIGIFSAILLFTNLLASFLKRFAFFKHKVTLPTDILVMRLIEVIQSIPGLFIMLAVLAIFQNDSIFNIMLIIGLISWPGIARFIRAELLRVRNLEFVEASRALGFSEWRIVFRHAIPNALAPVLISIAFGVAGAILAEATISFLGIGIPPEEVTWGKLLEIARRNNNAWWLAIFPGMAIFITVTIFNMIGEGLTDALDPRSHA